MTAHWRSPRPTAAADTLSRGGRERIANYPGDRADRQPVPTVYVPADRFHGDPVAEWCRSSCRAG